MWPYPPSILSCDHSGYSPTVTNYSPLIQTNHKEDILFHFYIYLYYWANQSSELTHTSYNICTHTCTFNCTTLVIKNINITRCICHKYIKTQHEWCIMQRTWKVNKNKNRKGVHIKWKIEHFPFWTFKKITENIQYIVNNFETSKSREDKHFWNFEYENRIPVLCRNKRRLQPKSFEQRHFQQALFQFQVLALKAATKYHQNSSFQKTGLWQQLPISTSSWGQIPMSSPS